MSNVSHRRSEVDPSRWRSAQVFEADYWVYQDRRPPWLRAVRRLIRLMLFDRRALVSALRHRDRFFFGDDYNYWWLEHFEGYRFLPDTAGRAVEIGSGPQSNLRLIGRYCDIGHLVAVDPLALTYARLRGSWVGWMHRRGRLGALTAMAESLALKTDSVDLICCINVLDHCRDAAAALGEMKRVLRPGGILLLATDLVDEDDVRLAGEDVGHPLRLDHEMLDGWVDPDFDPILRKVLRREETRVPTHHYGAYVYAGVKRRPPVASRDR